MTPATVTVHDSRTDTVVRGLVTIGALIVLFVGTHIPLPGLSPDRLRRILQHSAAPARVSVFALGVTPIIFARVILELCRLTMPPLAAWAAKSEHLALWTQL